MMRLSSPLFMRTAAVVPSTPLSTLASSLLLPRSRSQPRSFAHQQSRLSLLPLTSRNPTLLLSSSFVRAASRSFAMQPFRPRVGQSGRSEGGRRPSEDGSEQPPRPSKDGSEQPPRPSEDGSEPPPPSPPSSSSKLGTVLSVGAIAATLAGKTKYLLVAAKLTKAVPLISMLASTGAYAIFFGWPYAFGIVGLIFVHELGHVVALRHYKYDFSPMVFLPFMGAVISAGEMRNSYEDAVVALGGPIAGTLGACAVGVGGYVFDSQLLHALADFGYMLNLINLLPIGQMDGGRVGNALSPYLGVAGVATGVGLCASGMVSNPFFFVLVGFGGLSTAQRIFGYGEEHEKQQRGYYNMNGGQQLLIGGTYAGLAAALLALMAMNKKVRKPPRKEDMPFDVETVFGTEEDLVFGDDDVEISWK